MITDEEWTALVERGGTINHHDTIDPRRTALLVIDLQRGFTLPERPFGLPRALALVPLANRLATAIRDAGGHVVYTRHTYTDAEPQALAPWQLESPVIKALSEELQAGSEGHDLHPALDVRPGDLVLDKYRYSAFARHSSDLDERLRTLDVDTLVVMGCSASTCSESTTRDSYQLGYRTFYLSDGNAAATVVEERATRMVLGSVAADVRTSEELLELLATVPARG